MTLQEHIRTLRKERGLSQEALAEALGVSRQAVTKWEDGSALPSTANLLSLADFFGVPLGLSAAQTVLQRSLSHGHSTLRYFIRYSSSASADLSPLSPSC